MNFAAFGSATFLKIVRGSEYLSHMYILGSFLMAIALSSVSIAARANLHESVVRAILELLKEDLAEM
jgi:hypothetical protein